ncbi:MAG TPA: filamentous hemagglutinin [Cyanobacteria bacterium UBA11149]|nr:filamentous hemagglutinin [Cyanobacteria bacterium UBA11367]HBE56994.1 filamentous hemagglutinin [Cyanobacteria bacterium UBA11366]HBK63515.1 filamentous hemagglutinin [Cyanobacteria bacterium UBA11166]HBR75963.1 filamentous hemagglutinin [Cyanobacteria bacterium UBA11159]HBS72706.1 filamentous hemagglutinin [Cyanobacteria bacterium UBA11153]HBW88933.1 filamentous hemagglutinin [Cyanobacteria bacterium UBA11149]
MRCLVWQIAPIILIGLSTPTVNAQISPDATLRNNSIVNRVSQEWQIQGGETVGNNLFHSFSQFDIGTGETAYFQNNNSIINIITRVTGASSSNIDGIIKANGGANLFLINPYGIIFGANAKLNIGGSFLASTADSILFPDGSLFSATNPQPPPLLTINVPIGLQFGANPGGIAVSGTGNPLTVKGNPATAPLQRSSNTLGLQVKPGNTLALIGGDINLNGGLLTAESGHIELASIATGKVIFNPLTQGWNFNYFNVQNYGNIRLSNGALLDGSGSGGSGIDIIGRQITMSGGSLAFTNNQGSLPGGDINVFNSELIDLSGDNPKGIPSGLRTQTVGKGNAGNISVYTTNLLVRGGANIMSFTFNIGSGGDITIEANDELKLIGASPFSPQSNSGIRARTFGIGNGGDMTISTTHLQLIDGAVLANQTFGIGATGNLRIDVTDSVEIIGVNRFSPLSQRIRSGIGVGVGPNGSGNTGNLTINTSRLIVRDGGRINRDGGGIVPNTSGNRVDGSLTINASESIEVSGFDSDTSLKSFISSSVLGNQPIQIILGVPTVPVGNTGTLILNTPRLLISNSGKVSVENQGLGNAGEINISAREIILDEKGEINAATISGIGGNINLKIEDYLLLRNGGKITAQAGDMGDGGNINIESSLIVGITTENSEIIANAFMGNGGNINISTSGIFGLVPTRGPLNNSLSEINASSNTGIEGIVTINNPEVDPTSGLIKLPEEIVDSTKEVIVGCAAAEGNSFTITGRGGLPEDPTAMIRGETVWRDLQDFSLPTEGVNSSVIGKQSPLINSQLPSTNPEEPQIAMNDAEGDSFARLRHPKFRAPEGRDPNSPIIEATGWVTNEEGEVTLVAAVPDGMTSGNLTQPPNCLLKSNPEGGIGNGQN